MAEFKRKCVICFKQIKVTLEGPMEFGKKYVSDEGVLFIHRKRVWFCNECWNEIREVKNG